MEFAIAVSSVSGARVYAAYLTESYNAIRSPKLTSRSTWMSTAPPSPPILRDERDRGTAPVECRSHA